MTTETQRPDPQPDPRTVLAAGGIVLMGPADSPQLLVVHRPRYDDWSLPKGHVDDGEDLQATALREVAEETGVLAEIVHAAGTTEHTVATDHGPARKRVHWFIMRPDTTAGDPSALTSERTPDAEVDRVEWWTLDAALRALTHESDRALLRRVVEAS